MLIDLGIRRKSETTKKTTKNMNRKNGKKMKKQTTTTNQIALKNNLSYSKAKRTRERKTKNRRHIRNKRERKTFY